jgi:hypothetical protein
MAAQIGFTASALSDNGVRDHCKPVARGRRFCFSVRVF